MFSTSKLYTVQYYYLFTPHVQIRSKVNENMFREALGLEQLDRMHPSEYHIVWKSLSRLYRMQPYIATLQGTEATFYLLSPARFL